jgi:cyanophycinase-like exopeptidase
MVSMPHPSPGPLALLGGEALRSESAGLWQQLGAISPQGIAPIAILPTALAEYKPGVAERRAVVAQEALNNFGLLAQPVMLLKRHQAEDSAFVASLKQVASFYLTGGEPRSLYKVLVGSAAWEMILLHHQNGATLIAAGGAAVALGEVIFAPLKPFPRSVDALRFETSAGLGLLPRRMILPYFNWLPAQVLEQIAALCPSDLVLVGIDDQAALVAYNGKWEVYGSGNVTFLHPSRSTSTIPSGQPIPPDFLSPYPAR